MKQTSSHGSSVKQARREKEHLEVRQKLEDRSVHSKADPIEKINEEDELYLPYDIEYQLEMNIEKYSEQVKDELRYLLLDLLKYPSTKQAVRHRSANRLGCNDLRQIKNKLYGCSTFTSSRFKPDYCEDCGRLLQERQIPTFSSVWEFPPAGLATYRLYRFMKLIAVMLLILGIVFGILNMYVNIQTIGQVGAPLDGETYPILFLNTVELLNYSTYPVLVIAMQVSAFLLILTVLLWWLFNLSVIFLSQKYERIMDQTFISPSDFSIMLENVPIHYSEQKLKAQFQRYFESLVFSHNIKDGLGEELKPFTVNKICKTVPFAINQSEVFDKELEGLDRDILEKKKLFADWVLEMKTNSHFSYTKAEREREYSNYERMLERRKRKLLAMRGKMREQFERANDRIKTTVILCFEYNQSAQLIEKMNPQTIPAKIRYHLSFCKSTQYFDVRDLISNEESDIVASRAPEPEDIIWGNVAVPLCILVVRKLITWGIMIVMSGTLLGIIYGISEAQVNGTGIWSSVFIGLLVTSWNLMTKFVLRKISPYEKDFTQTDRQRGILLKGLLVMAFNWTVPIAVSNVANESNNIFGLNGLAYEVFYISIFECFLPPLVRIFDPEHFFRAIWGWWKNRPANKMVLKQGQLNDYLDNTEYQLGYAYLYFFNIMFFSCFYVNLYPGVVIVALMGCFLMFWAEKYCLLNRSQRPQKIAYSLEGTVQTLLSLFPLALWVGHIVWINGMISDFSSIIFTGDMLLMALSLLYFISPWKSIHACLAYIPPEQILRFEECKPRFVADYFTLNPANLQAESKLVKSKVVDKDSDLNRSEDHLSDPLDQQYIFQELAMIPSIFGRQNEVSRKLEKEDTIKPRNVRGQDIQMLLVPERRNNLSPTHQSHIKVRVGSKQSSAPVNPRQDTEQAINKRQHQQDLSHEETEKKVMLNVSSSGNAFGRRRDANAKRKSVSVVNRPQEYEYDRHARHK